MISREEDISVNNNNLVIINTIVVQYRVTSGFTLGGSDILQNHQHFRREMTLSCPKE